MRHTISLPHSSYITPNYRGGHWGERKACAAAWRQATYLIARRERVPRMARARVILEVHPPDRRPRDPSNFSLVLKWCEDGLVDAGVLATDTSEHVALAGMTVTLPPPPRRGVKRPPWRWYLHVEDADDEISTAVRQAESN